MKKLSLFLLSLTCAFNVSAQDWRNYSAKPALGWNSFNCYGAVVEEHEVRANTDFMDKNLKEYGWEYIVLDFCWFYPTPPGSYRSNPPQFRMTDGSLVPWFPMDEYGRLYPDTRKFPSASDGNGLKALGDYIHSRGLKFGLHIMRGIPRQAVYAKSKIKGAEGVDASMIADTTRICNWLNSMYGIDTTKQGAQEYYDSLFELYASWGVDYVKYDDLNNPNIEDGYHKGEVEAIRKAIDKCGRPMVLSLSPGMSREDGEHINQYANSWRISKDFWDSWEQLREQFDICAEWNDTRRYGTWPDADMLQLGRLALRGPVGEPRSSNFTRDEQLTHYTLWCLYKSPLMIGCDLPTSSKEVIEVFQNKDLLEIQQNGENPHITYSDDKTIVWASNHFAKTGTKYVAIFNVSEEDNVVKLKASDYVKGSYTIRDIWAKSAARSGSSTISSKVAKHGVVLYELIEK